MNSLLVALCLAVGAAVWVYVKVGRRTGNADPKSLYMLAGATGVAAFIVFITLFKWVINF